jgi:O-antigen/teichoic acid export membrane protein
VGWHTPLVYCGTLAASWSYDACFAVLRTLGRFRFLAIQGVIATAVRVPFLGFAIVASGSLDVLLAAYVVYEGVWSAWLVWKTDREFARAFGVSLRLAPSRPIREVVTEARSLLLVNSALDTVKLVTSRADTLALGWFRPPSEVALYQAAFTFFDGLLRVQQQLYMVLFSHATRLAGRGDHEGLLRLGRSVGSLGLAVGAVIGAALAVGAPYLVWLVFGADYEASTPLLRWLALGALSCSGLWMQPLFVSMGRSSWGLAYNVALLCLKLALLGALTPTHGARGVAMAVGMYYGSVPLFGLGFYLRARAALRARSGIDRDTASLLL